jgi:hypothetical protein
MRVIPVKTLKVHATVRAANHQHGLEACSVLYIQEQKTFFNVFSCLTYVFTEDETDLGFVNAVEN